MSHVRRLDSDLCPTKFENEIVSVEYDYKEIHPAFERGRNYFFQKNYTKAHEKFVALTKRYPNENINHKLADFYLGRIKELLFKSDEESKNEKTPTNGLKA
jgi:TolA-binding protein